MSSSSLSALGFLESITQFVDGGKLDRPVRLGTVPFPEGWLTTDDILLRGGDGRVTAAAVMFDGETTVTPGRRYVCLQPSSVRMGSRVVLIPVSSSYVIAGVIDSPTYENQPHVLQNFGRWENRAAGSVTTVGNIVLPDPGYPFAVEVSGQAEIMKASLASRYEIRVADAPTLTTAGANVRVATQRPGVANDWSHGFITCYFPGPYMTSTGFSVGATCSDVYSITDYNGQFIFRQIPVAT